MCDGNDHVVLAETVCPLPYITLSILPNKLFVGISDKLLKFLADGICKSLLPVVAAGERCILAIVT